MYTDAGGDEVSGISAADLAQRLVEHSSSRRKAAHRTVTQPTTPRAPLPARVEALVWSAASACGVVPRSSLLRGDIVQEAAGNTDGVLISLSLSPDVRFRFAQTRQRRLVCVLSARTSAASLDLRKVETAHFYWMDECVPWAGHDDRLRTAALQKKLISWALHTFAGNPHMKNISLQAIEAAFPALLAYAPHEREELAQQAAAMLGRGMVVWYGGTLIKQYHDGPSSLLFPLLSRREERCAATLLFALANAQQLLAGRLSNASHAARYLLETYGAANIALSPALTHALLIAASALADVYTCTPKAERTIHSVADGYLALLAAASVADVCSLVRSVESSPPPKMRSLLSQIHDVARRTCCTLHHRVPPHRDGKAHARTVEEDDDVNAFFSVNDALHLSAATLESRLDAGAAAQLPLSTSSPSDCAQRVLLLGWVPRWWEGSMQALHTGGATAETELKINAKTAAALLLEPMAGEQAMLAVIQKTRRRRRGDGVQFSSQAVRTALDEAGVQLKRRSFLQLVDTLALSDDVESRVDAATHFLQKQLVDDSHIRLFTHTLTAMQDS